MERKMLLVEEAQHQRTKQVREVFGIEVWGLEFSVQSWGLGDIDVDVDVDA